MKILKNAIFLLACSGLFFPAFAQNLEGFSVYRKTEDTSEGRFRTTVSIHENNLISALEESLKVATIHSIKVDNLRPIILPDDLFDSASIPLQLSVSVEGGTSNGIYCVLNTGRRHIDFSYSFRNERYASVLEVRDCFDENNRLTFHKEIFSDLVYHTSRLKSNPTIVIIEREICADKVYLSSNSENCSRWVSTDWGSRGRTRYPYRKVVF